MKETAFRRETISDLMIALMSNLPDWMNPPPVHPHEGASIDPHQQASESGQYREPPNIAMARSGFPR